MEPIATSDQSASRLATHTNLAPKLNALEHKYGTQFKVVFDAIRELMQEDKPRFRREIGFHTGLPRSRRGGTQ